MKTINNSGSYIPVSKGQEYMIYGENYGEKDAKAILVEGRILHGRIDKQVIKESIIKTAENHEALRMVCRNIDNKYYLFVNDKADEDCIWFSEKMMSESEIRNDVMDFVSSSVPVDKYMFYVRIYSFSEDRHALVIIMHHLISDPITLSIVLNEILRRADGETNIPSAGKYSDFLKSESEFSETSKGREQIAYWENEMDGYAAPPGDGGGISYDVIKESTIIVKKSDADKKAGDLKVSTFVLLLASAHLALGRMTKTEDTTIGIAFANRLSVSQRGMVGYLSHMVQNRIRNTERNNTDLFVKKVSEKMSENIRMQRLSHYVKGSRVNIGMQGDQLHNRTDFYNSIPTEKMIFDFERHVDYLMIGVFPAGDDYIIHLICDPKVYSKDYIHKFTALFSKTINGVINNQEGII